MIIRKTFTVILLTGIILGLGSVASAKSDSDPIITFQTSTKLEVDLGIMIEDLLPALLESLEAEDAESVEMAQFFLNQLGLDALQILKMEAKQTKENSHSKTILTLDPEKTEGLIPRYFRTPNRKCGFADYVSKDELVMFMTLHNFASYFKTTLEFLAKPELAEFVADFPLDENGDLVIGEINLRTDLLPLLSGELDFFAYENPEGQAASPFSTPYFLVLGANDGLALKNKILELSTMMGAGFAGMIESIEAEEIGVFQFQELPFGALAISQDYLVLSLAAEPLRQMLEAASGDLKVPTGIEWVYLNGPKYHTYMNSMMDMVGAMSPESLDENQLMLKISSTMFEYIETEEVLVKTNSAGLEIRTEVEGPLMTGLYELIYVMIQELPDYLEQQRLKNADSSDLTEYQDAIETIDKAMMIYADENGGTYPDDPETLYHQGYLETFPLGTRIAAGDFLDWGYTYILVRDDDGAAVGYYLFLFGGDEWDGFDVFTPENLLDMENFLIDRDGIADGVASFCYDGVVVEQIREYWGD